MTFGSPSAADRAAVRDAGVEQAICKPEKYFNFGLG
jgi:hypothetical protein